MKFLFDISVAFILKIIASASATQAQKSLRSATALN